MIQTNPWKLSYTSHHISINPPLSIVYSYCSFLFNICNLTFNCMHIIQGNFHATYATYHSYIIHMQISSHYMHPMDIHIGDLRHQHVSDLVSCATFFTNDSFYHNQRIIYSTLYASHHIGISSLSKTKTKVPLKKIKLNGGGGTKQHSFFLFLLHINII